jgi:putative SOS response-associated peptidase YedK
MGNRVALSLEPLEVEEWLKALKRKEGLSNPVPQNTLLLVQKRP